MVKENFSEKTLGNLAKYLEKYIKAILKEYGNAIPINRIKELENISDYRSILVLNPEQTISFYCSGDKIYLPQYASEILNKIKHIPGFGINKNHKCYKNNEILNNTSYFGYTIHVFLKGLNIEDFFLETLLHETVHLCGSDGGEPFREGLTEIKAREISKKYGFPLSRCGYNKEVAIVSQIQDILGKDLINRIAFSSDKLKVYNDIRQQYGDDVYDIISNIRQMMKKECLKKYELTRIKGPFSAINKAISYDSLDYSKVLPLIEELRVMVQKKDEQTSKHKENDNPYKYTVLGQSNITNLAKGINNEEPNKSDRCER